jgi:hypothetical protein
LEQDILNEASNKVFLSKIPGKSKLEQSPGSKSQFAVRSSQSAPE